MNKVTTKKARIGIDPLLAPLCQFLSNTNGSDVARAQKGVASRQDAGDFEFQRRASVPRVIFSLKIIVLFFFGL